MVLAAHRGSHRCAQGNSERLPYYQYGERVVHLMDGCVEVAAAYYSTPPGWIGRPVQVQWDETRVRILNPHTSELLREHLRQRPGGYRVEEEDHPKKMPLSTAQLLRRAERAGTQIGVFCNTIYQQEGHLGIRRIMKEPGLDNRFRDKNAPKGGEIRQKRGHALNKNLSQPIPEFSPNATLARMRKEIGEVSIKKYARRPKS